MISSIVVVAVTWGGLAAAVTYALNTADVNGSAFDAEAASMYGAFDRTLDRFDCPAADNDTAASGRRYSIHKHVNCSSCREAYKYWVCAMKFTRCGPAGSGSGGDGDTASGNPAAMGCHTEPDSRAEGAALDCRKEQCLCSNAPGGCCSTGRRKTCLSICQDVVRKCPYIAGVECPPEETDDYSADSATCHKLDREKVYPTGEPWPGSFSMSGTTTN